MKIQITHYDRVHTVETPNEDIDIPQFLELLDGLMRSVGYVFNGELDIVEEDS